MASGSVYRFLVVVLSAYKQIRAQSVSVLADIENKNFDKAFEFLRPSSFMVFLVIYCFSSRICIHSDSRRSGNGSSALRG